MYVILSIVALVAAIAFIVSPRVAQRLYAGMIFAPTKAHRPYGRCRLSGIEAQDIVLKSSWGRKLHGWFFRSDKSPALILVNHSNAGNVDEWSPLVGELLATGASVLIYDYQGYGLSEGNPTVRGACRDGLAAYDYAVGALGFKPQHIVMYGSSLGCSVATYVAGKRSVGFLVLHAAFSSMRQVATEMLPATRFVPDLLFFRPRMDNVALLRRIKVPLRVVHGQWDEMFDHRHPEALFAAAASPDKRLVFLPNCSHMARDDNHQAVVQEAVQAVEKQTNAA